MDGGEGIRAETGVGLGQSGDSKVRAQRPHAGKVGTSERVGDRAGERVKPDEDSEWEAGSHPQGDAELVPRQGSSQALVCIYEDSYQLLSGPLTSLQLHSYNTGRRKLHQANASPLSHCT